MERKTRVRVFGNAGSARAGLLAALCALGLVGCTERPSGPSHAESPPEHPAMSAPASARSAPGSSTGSSALPPDHPPIGPSTASSAPLTADPVPATAEDGRLTVAGLDLAVPEGWVSETPSMSMRLAQFRLPRAEGDGEDGVLAVYPPIAGSVEDNVLRWSRQFQGAPPATTEEKTVREVSVTLVSIEGTYLDRVPGAPGAGTVRPGYALWGAIAQAPSGQVFFKAWGPKSTMEKWAGSFEKMVDSFAPAR